MPARSHGMTCGEKRARIYYTWRNMKSRCYNPKNAKYKNYGGRGITVCDEWVNNFNSFLVWAYFSDYSDELTIERIDVNVGYSPENCTWIPAALQARNRTYLRAVVRDDGAFFERLTDAANATGTTPVGISQVLIGRAKKAGGYSWRAATEEEKAFNRDLKKDDAK